MGFSVRRTLNTVISKRSTMNRAWAYTLVYNEAALIPYWVRHYRTFCERVVVFVDAETDDDTLELAEREGAETLVYYGDGHLDDVAFVDFAQQEYKVARGEAEWVIWTDADEILYHPLLADRLDKYRSQGVNLPRTVGYSMMATQPPSGPGQIYEQIPRGFEAKAYAKVCVFDPELDVYWTAGKHDATVIGPAVRDDGSDPLKLLHYRWLGEEYFLKRNQRNYARVDPGNRLRMHGKETYPDYQGEYSPAWYVGRIELAKVCV